MADENRARGRGRGRNRGQSRGQSPARGVEQEDDVPHHRDQRDLEIAAQARRIRELERLLAASGLSSANEKEEESDSVAEEEEGDDNPIWNRGRNQGFRPRGQSTPTFGAMGRRIREVERLLAKSLGSTNGKRGQKVTEHDVDREARRNQQLRREVIQDSKVLVEKSPKSGKAIFSDFCYDSKDLFTVEKEDSSVTAWDEYFVLENNSSIVWDTYLDEEENEGIEFTEASTHEIGGDKEYKSGVTWDKYPDEDEVVQLVENQYVVIWDGGNGNVSTDQAVLQIPNSSPRVEANSNDIEKETDGSQDSGIIVGEDTASHDDEARPGDSEYNLDSQGSLVDFLPIKKRSSLENIEGNLPSKRHKKDPNLEPSRESEEVIGIEAYMSIEDMQNRKVCVPCKFGKLPAKIMENKVWKPGIIIEGLLMWGPLNDEVEDSRTNLFLAEENDAGATQVFDPG